jgi:hypothetical protein
MSPKGYKDALTSEGRVLVGENIRCEGAEYEIGWGFDETKERIKGCMDAVLRTVGEEVV